MKEKLLALTIGILIGIFILFLINTCKRNDVTETVTKKTGKTELVKQTTTVTVDSQAIFKKFYANTKPVIKWLKPKAVHDTVNPNVQYSPCDSVVSMLDTGTFQGIKYSILDTISDNRIKGRSVKFEVPQVTINNNTTITNDSLRVDTVYVKQKEKKKWFSINVGAGFGFSPLSPTPEPQIGIQAGFKLKSF